MPAELINLLTQIPIVAVFLWYVDRTNKQFMNFLLEQRIEDRKVMESLTSEIKSVVECITEHQAVTVKDHAVILDRLATQPLKKVVDR